MCHRIKGLWAIAGALLLLAAIRHETINADEERKPESEEQLAVQK
jgi:hypothetical protein